eukprot:SAG22_NODE_860_length_6828_cov_5.663100_4_plen_451_part_00
MRSRPSAGEKAALSPAAASKCWMPPAGGGGTARPRQWWLPLLLLAVAGSLVGRAAAPESCVDDNVALNSLIGTDCATVARLSQLPATSNHNPGLCLLLNASNLLGLCCDSCLALDECASNPCLNGAVCHAPADRVDYNCECAEIASGIYAGYPAFEGEHCETPYIPRETCPAGMYVTKIMNDTEAYAAVGCRRPSCYPINQDNDWEPERCRTCTVCGPGFTFSTPCTNFSDTVSSKALAFRCASARIVAKTFSFRIVCLPTRSASRRSARLSRGCCCRPPTSTRAARPGLSTRTRPSATTPATTAGARQPAGPRPRWCARQAPTPLACPPFPVLPWLSVHVRVSSLALPALAVFPRPALTHGGGLWVACRSATPTRRGASRTRSPAARAATTRRAGPIGTATAAGPTPARAGVARRTSRTATASTPQSWGCMSGSTRTTPAARAAPRAAW